jgi:4'-phosphopantetheinyl transferase
VRIHDPILELDSDNLHWLTDDELGRYEAISSANRKLQFLAGHYLVRKMASCFYQNNVEDWEYVIDTDNLRRLRCRQTGIAEPYVSLSHSGVWIAAAVSDSPVGLDIETYEKQRDFIAIANHVFSDDETNLLKSLSPDQICRQFYLYWTLKECVAKRHGAGLKFEVSRVHSFIPAATVSGTSIFSWQCPQYVLALAGNPEHGIDTSGLCEDAGQRYWQNISVISSLAD